MRTYNEMLAKLNKQVSKAKEELLKEGIIGGIFNHMISDSISVSNNDRQDILVSICPWSMDFDKGEMCLGLFGIDEEGSTDLISVSHSTNSEDLLKLYNELKVISENGYYDNVVEYSICG